MASNHRCLFVTLLMTLCLTAGNVRSQDEPNDGQLARTLFQDYVDLLKSGNYETATDLWEPEIVESAGRLNMNYEGIAIKADMNSPAINNLDKMKPILQAGIRSENPLGDDFRRFTFDVDLHGTRQSTDYFMHKKDGYFWLSTSYMYYTADWIVAESKYFRYHIDPMADDRFNKIAAASLDDFVERLAEIIDIPAERMNLLEEKKIDYYLCRNEGVVFSLLRRRAPGVFDPAMDAVVATVFPMYNRVARLLVNFKLQNLPPATAPFIRDGLAIYLGGAWQRSPEVITDFGEYILRYDVIEIDSILTGGIIDEAGDIATPANACLVEYLINRLGWVRFWEFYRKCSGSVPLMSELTPDEVKIILTTFLEEEWDKFTADVKDYIDSRKAHGGAVFPGIVNTDKELVKDGGLVITASDKWIQMECSAVESEYPNIQILFGKTDDLENKESTLFTEQNLSGNEFEGYRFGIKIDKNEIGVYDFAANLLKAKYVNHFDPDAKYYNADEKKVTVYFDIGLLDGVLPQAGEYRIID